MSFASLEREVVAQTRVLLCNAKIRNKDIMEWSTGTPEAQEGEIAVKLSGLGVTVVISKTLDKRKPAPASEQPERREGGA